MWKVQRVAPCGGGESLNVNPQAKGGRKIYHLVIINLICIILIFESFYVTTVCKG